MRDCNHRDCQTCRDDHERGVLVGTARHPDAIARHYLECAARVHFASRALTALIDARAPRDLIRAVQGFLHDVGNTGD